MVVFEFVDDVDHITLEYSLGDVVLSRALDPLRVVDSRDGLRLRSIFPLPFPAVIEQYEHHVHVVVVGCLQET